MADIDVVPKHRSNAWIWILLAIVVIGVIVWAFAGRSRAVAGLRLAPEGAISQHSPAAVVMPAA